MTRHATIKMVGTALPTRLLLVAVAAFGPGCGVEQGSGGAPEQTVGELHSSLTEGETAARYGAVGSLEGAGTLCTATLVGRHTLLTAAHCVGDAPLQVRLGGRSFAVLRAARHPEYVRGEARNDIAALVLAQSPVTAPIAIASKPVALGGEVVLLGHAAGRNGKGATKHVAHSRLLLRTGARIGFLAPLGTPVVTCGGDGGGPTLVARKGRDLLVGLHAHASTTCASDSWDVRVARHLEWLEHVSDGDVLLESDQPLLPVLRTLTTTAVATKPGQHADSSAPLVTIGEPQDGSHVPSSFSATVAAVDDRQVRLLRMKVDGRLLFVHYADAARFVLKLGNGLHRLTAEAEDWAGNVGRRRITVEVESPSAKASAPPDVALTRVERSGEGFVFEAAVTSPHGPVRVELWAGGRLVQRLDGPPYRLSSKLDPGDAKLELRAVDGAGRQGREDIELDVLPELAQGTAAGCSLSGPLHGPSSELGALALALLLLLRRRRGTGRGARDAR